MENNIIEDKPEINEVDQANKELEALVKKYPNLIFKSIPNYTVGFYNKENGK